MLAQLDVGMDGFQSAPPVRGATLRPPPRKTERLFQSAPPVRGATWHGDSRDRLSVVSIRAPREGSDLGRVKMSRRSQVSIRAPREGSDHAPSGPSVASLVFQSAPPVRGATRRVPFRTDHPFSFNPRPP